jgi:hypothetical protein
MNTTMLPQLPCSPDLAPGDFLFSQTEIHIKSDDFRQFKRLQNICRWSYAQSKKGIPRLCPVVATLLGAVHQCREYFEGDKAHSVVGMSEKVIKK